MVPNSDWKLIIQLGKNRWYFVPEIEEQIKKSRKI
jgi:hypothetical protein